MKQGRDTKEASRITRKEIRLDRTADANLNSIANRLHQEKENRQKAKKKRVRGKQRKKGGQRKKQLRSRAKGR